MSNQFIPKFIQNAPHGADKFEGKSAEKVAEAIKSHIIYHNENDKLPKIIGIDGEWGSGKSNVIKILSQKLGDSYYLFEYDAWGHQEDLQRRSFLENLTAELLEKKILFGTTTIKIKCGDTKNGTWNEKLKYLLAKKSETETTSYPKIGYGIIVAFITAIFMPIFNYIANVINTKSYWSTIIVMIPLIFAAIIWAVAAIKNKKYRSIGFLLVIYQDKITEGVKFETISAEEPTVTDFRNWMKDVANALHNKKLIIVFDNMDRLPAEKVKELWSSIHTFFAENGYPNIWLIIPFDKKHLANAFGNQPDNLELTNHFINKTFPVIYRVAPPVITDWKKIFNEFYEEAFINTEDSDKDTVLRIFGIIRSHFTPRDIIAYINELVSLKRIWKNHISILPIAIFALKKDDILQNPVDCILSGSYLKAIEKIVSNSEELQDQISALTYGVDLEIAKQIPLMQYIRGILKGETEQDINKYSEHRHFVQILDEVIQDIDTAVVENTIINLSNLRSANLDITAQWNKLAKLDLYQKINTQDFKDTHKALLSNVDDHNRRVYLKHLCDNFRECVEFKGELYFIAMDSIDRYITEQKLNISIFDYIIEITVEPSTFVDYANQAKDEYRKYKVSCDNTKLNEYLISLMPAKLPKMNFVKYLIDDQLYSFDVFCVRIQNSIAKNEIDINNFSMIIDTYKLISKEKPLKQQFSMAQLQTLIAANTNKTSEAYYDLVAMGLSNKIDFPYSVGLDEKIVQRLEYYQAYGDLLLLAKDWTSNLLRKSLNIMTTKSYGTLMTIEKVLPYFDEIKNAINIAEDIFLNELAEWNMFDKKITVENLEKIITKYSFYQYAAKIKNGLTDHVVKTAINKLESIAEDELYKERNTTTYYWLNCASLLIHGKRLTNLPDNLTNLCKKILLDISAGEQAIPVLGGILDTILNQANKNKLQPTIKNICDDFCNKSKLINPKLFTYFTTNFDFIKGMHSRDGDIARNILNVIIKDNDCLNLILRNSEVYINIINKAGNDAEDLKGNVIQLLTTNYSAELHEFAMAIGLKDGNGNKKISENDLNNN